MRGCGLGVFGVCVWCCDTEILASLLSDYVVDFRWIAFEDLGNVELKMLVCYDVLRIGIARVRARSGCWCSCREGVARAGLLWGRWSRHSSSGKEDVANNLIRGRL